MKMAWRLPKDCSSSLLTGNSVLASSCSKLSPGSPKPRHSHIPYGGFKPYIHTEQVYSISEFNPAPRNIPLKLPLEHVQTTTQRNDPLSNHFSLKTSTTGGSVVNMKLPVSNAPDLQIGPLLSSSHRQMNLQNGGSTPTRTVNLKRSLKGSDSEADRKRLRQIRFEESSESSEGESLDDYMRRRFRSRIPTVPVDDQGRRSRSHQDRSVILDRAVGRNYSQTTSLPSEGDNGGRRFRSTTPYLENNHDEGTRPNSTREGYYSPAGRDLEHSRKVHMPFREVTKVKTVIIDGYSVGRVFGKGRLDWNGIWICYNSLRILATVHIVVMISEEKVNDDLAANRWLIRQLDKERVLWQIKDNQAAYFMLKTAERRDAALISNCVWKKVRSPPDYLTGVKDRTFPFEVKDGRTITFLAAGNGRYLEEVLANPL